MIGYAQWLVENAQAAREAAMRRTGAIRVWKPTPRRLITARVAADFSAFYQAIAAAQQKVDGVFHA